MFYIDPAVCCLALNFGVKGWLPHSIPDSNAEPVHPEFFKFCGRMIGLALMHEVQGMLEMAPDEIAKLGLTHVGPNGKSMAVSSTNMIEYANEYVRKRFLVSTRTRAAQISEGFEDIMPSKDCMTRFFSCITREDFGYMLGGCLDDISVEDRRLNTDYGGYQNTDYLVLEDCRQIVTRGATKTF
ncbi:hypothetical protein QQ045_017769 [Rhodiola kirilowii]